MDTLIGVFFILFSYSCHPSCIKEIPQVYQTRAECEVALAKWSQRSIGYMFFYQGHLNSGICIEQKLTQREINAYGGVK